MNSILVEEVLWSHDSAKRKNMVDNTQQAKWMIHGGNSWTARFDRLPWFSYHSADAVPIEGTVL